MIRGATLLPEICPNVGEVNSKSGSLNCGWLKALKNSERNSRNEFSRPGICRFRVEDTPDLANEKIVVTGALRYKATDVDVKYQVVQTT
jgi:hypothetical protein